MIVARPKPDSWTVTCVACPHAGAPEGIVGRSFAAEVPGCVHLDLIRAGVIPPVDEGDGEARQEWVGHADWEWCGTVEADARAFAAPRAELVFDSLDTVAEVRVNGASVGAAASQFVQHRFDVRGVLREGANEVRVRVRAPVPYVLAEQERLGARPVNGDWTPYPFVRKSACNFGWDWGPRVPTSGMPGDVRLECWGPARIAAVRPLVTSCDARQARVEVRVALELDAGAAAAGVRVRCELRMPPREANAEPDHRKKSERRPAKLVQLAEVDASGHAVAVFELERPERWWPRGFGAQPLHTLHVDLATPDGSLLEPAGERQRTVRRIGLRSCELDASPDEFGTRFAFRVNGVHVPVVGANWIPASLFPMHGRDDSTIDALLDRAVAANLNMLRVWGGGIYEHERFYDRCDELGMLVWQDFMFACATYPEDDPMPALVDREAREQVSRLCGHPSIVLWCGGNEDVLAWQSWGFRERLAAGQSWGIRYWQEILPKACAELDPTRPYWVDSPWSGSLDRHANDPDHGDRHTWDLKLDGYRTMVPRFTSEFGHQAPPTLRSIREALGDAALRIGSPELAVRQRAWGGDDAQYAPYLAAAFHPARDFAEWLWQAQLLQAGAMETQIAWLRANPARNAGSLFWQLNDVWTGHSWSVVDARMRAKPSFHAVRRAAAPRLVTIQPIDDPAAPGTKVLSAVLVNDTHSKWSARVHVRRIDAAGATLAEVQVPVTVRPRSVDASIDVLAIVGAPADPSVEAIVVDVASHEDAIRDDVPLVDRDRMRAWWWFAQDVARPRTEPRFDVSVQRSVSDWYVRIHARTIVRDLWIEPEGDWVECSPNLLSLLPGEKVQVAVRMHGDSSQAPSVRILAH
jgi:beta-mannosidase